MSKELYEATIEYTKNYNGESWIATISDEKYIDMDTFERVKADLEAKLAEKDKEITQRLVIQERDYNQDKISFAVEQLEKVKEYIKTNLMSFQKVPIIQEIDNQIKQLKEMK